MLFAFVRNYRKHFVAMALAVDIEQANRDVDLGRRLYAPMRVLEA